VETIERFLERVEADADKLGVYLTPPLPEYELKEMAESIRADLGLTIPEGYMRLLLFTNGIVTQSGYLSSLEDIREQNATIWFMESKSGADAEGNFEIRFLPLETPLTPTYIWLGYDGNSAEQVFDLATGEYRKLVLGGTGVPRNRYRSLVGLLRHMIYGDPTPE
jgi:hypothetical protein